MITGYRRYQLKNNLLTGATGFEWTSRELEAECRDNRIVRGTSPADRALSHLTHDVCSCGIYVAKRPDIGFDYTSYPIIAGVTAWGAYIEYELGWRMQYARLEYLWVEPKDEPLIPQLISTYRVGVSVRTAALCCGQDHPMRYWRTRDGTTLSICQMETSHIVNIIRWIERGNARYYRQGSLWVAVLQEELVRRAPRRNEQGRLVVRF